MQLTLSVPALLTLLLLAACSSEEQQAGEPWQQQSRRTCFFAVTSILSETARPRQSVRFARALLPSESSTTVWQFSSYDIPSYRDTGLHLQHHLKITTQAGIVVHPDQTFTLDLPAIAYPLAVTVSKQPLWLMISPGPATAKAWMAPAFTPDIAEQAQRETLKRARLTESMADDAYYFGYSSNDDALE